MADLEKLLIEFASTTKVLLPPELSEEELVAAFERIATQTELLLDAVLVREAQELSAYAFWNDDE